ncbi:hypothetical protein B0H10DRAFT_2099166 [Mycena sp. CBHHK59/15]|nr:hypothetical protein B0H10DRAFT_2099166 [Mycena sp. CBHHK59/15]
MQSYFIVSLLYLLLLAFHAMLECTTITAYASRTCAIATIMLGCASLGSWKV